MGKKLYVGNLPYSATEESLESLFGGFGEVSSASVIKDRDTGRSKGFAFVEMVRDEDAEKAIAELDGTRMGEREIRVNEAKPQGAGGGRPGGGRPGGGRPGGGGRRDGGRSGGGRSGGGRY